MGLLGVISGTIIMERSDLVKNSKFKLMKNEFGQALVLLSDKIALILRHGNDLDSHILPHMINHAANLRALKDLGVTEVVGINSTGSLKKDLCPGMIVIPDDFITLTATPTIHENSAVHITPSLNEKCAKSSSRQHKTAKFQPSKKELTGKFPVPGWKQKRKLK